MQIWVLLVFCVAPLWGLPLEEETKVPLRSIGERIISGSTASKGQFPWQVAVYFRLSDGTHFCGGSLISTSWVLTAAHCARGASNFTLYFGTNTLNPDSGTTVVSTTQAIVHPQYNQNSLANDIALIRLPSPISLNSYIQTIRLASSTLGSGVSLTVSGWGKTSDSSSTVSNTLNYVGLTSITNVQCSNYYGNINSGMVCAAGASGSRQSTCNGDSGGPLITGSGSNAVHVGVVSFVSSRGCESGYPSGYTRTYYYREWIRQETGI